MHNIAEIESEYDLHFQLLLPHLVLDVQLLHFLLRLPNTNEGTQLRPMVCLTKAQKVRALLSPSRPGPERETLTYT